MCEEVSLYRVTDQEGQLKGHVYLDPNIRKYGRPWCEEVSLCRVTDQEGQLKGHVYLDPYIR